MTPSIETRVGKLVEFFEGPPAGGLPDNWWRWPNVQDAHRALATKFIENIPPYPKDRFAGRGIVICAGGKRLFTNGWVCMRLLRMHGVELPIQFWHLENEMDDDMAELVRPYGVECVDAAKLKKELGTRIVNGYEVKPFAMLHCPFKEVLLLDADNVPVKSPMFLFDCDKYKETGALFWPDYSKLARNSEIWRVFETDYDDYPDQHEFESGQILVDKEQHWKAMNLTMFMNEHSDYYYRFIHGDKCTFEMAWKRLREPFYLESRTIHALDATMCQHSPVDHSRLFQHRNLDKWMLEGNNRRIGDFWLEDECRAFLKELREEWSGQPFVAVASKAKTNKNVALSNAFDEIAESIWMYNRVGHDKREIQFLSNGHIGKGKDECEQFWSLATEGGTPVLTISGKNLTCRLRKDGDVWKGQWISHERMAIELSKVTPKLPEPKQLVAEARVAAAEAKAAAAEATVVAELPAQWGNGDQQKTEKLAFLVVGPESSGVGAMIEMLSKLGAQGAAKNEQPFDGPDFTIKMPKEAGDIVAVGRTMPHGGVWVDLPSAANIFRIAGYKVMAVVMLRSWKKMEELQVQRHPSVNDLPTADANILRAYATIFDGLLKGEIEYLMVNSECLSQQDYRIWLSQKLGLKTNTDFSPDADAD